MASYSRRKFLEMLDASMAAAMPRQMASATSGGFGGNTFADAGQSKASGHVASGWVVSALRSRKGHGRRSASR